MTKNCVKCQAPFETEDLTKTLCPNCEAQASAAAAEPVAPVQPEEEVPTPAPESPASEALDQETPAVESPGEEPQDSDPNLGTG